MSTEQTDQCRSMSPAPGGELAPIQCEKPRGHKKRSHSNPLVQRDWTEGIKKPARWITPDDGYRSEGELYAMYRSGARW